MISAAARLIARRGAEGTSLAEILRESGAPRGSIYYYFPAGKPELVEDAVRWTTEAVVTFQRGCRATTIGGVIRHFVGFFRRSLHRSECRDGCPLAAVAVGAYESAELLRASVRQGFRAWASVLTLQFRSVGLSPRSAQNLAIMTLAAVEGALILARAEGSIDPLTIVERQLRTLATNLR